MAKKAVIGISPKDSSMDKMDRYIKRNDAREAERFKRYGPSTKKKPFEERPLLERIAYLENMTPEQKFDRKYFKYSVWYEEVKEEMEQLVYPSYFIDATNKIKPEMQKMFEDKTSVKETCNTLKVQYKIY